MFAFFPNEITDLKFTISADGQSYREITPGKEMYFQGTGDYGYWKPVLYQAGNLGSEQATWLKISLTGETQISRALDKP